MHRKGHIGVALLCYVPVLLAVDRLAAGLLPVAVLGAVLLADLLLPITFLTAVITSRRRSPNVSFSPAMLPDLDMRIPGVKHRGITHTVWFGLIAAALFGAVGYQLDSGLIALSSTSDAARPLAFAFAYLGLHAVVTHLLADMLTPAGIRPFAPLSSRKFSLNLVRAANPVANVLLYVAGIAGVAGAVYVTLIA